MPKQRERFSGRQITVVIAAVCATVVAMPVAVYAAASVVNIGDPYSGSRARVFSGKLQVGDGLGPVTVDGIVNVKPPAGNYSRFKLVTDAAAVALYDIPANAGLAITTLDAAHESGTGPVMVRL